MSPGVLDASHDRVDPRNENRMRHRRIELNRSGFIGDCSVWVRSRCQRHLFFFIPLPSRRQSRCQPDDKHAVTRHYEECIVSVIGRRQREGLGPVGVVLCVGSVA